ncbi:vesicular mannose-binding lectin [Anaeramoeba flamelloides]|uniref:Vesicular mannose-binding lectin n=1 Tax=Anaeramoeba flamelloides TaxID=1746091 RepID=A0AAV7Y5S9_9EUKA|nr:vesicular mannose-binding lectin [Anaeramoeba flamelloides]
MKLLLIFLFVLSYQSIVCRQDSSMYSIPNNSNEQFIKKNWDLYGSAYVEENGVVLTPKEQSTKGSIWHKIPNQSPNWDLEVDINVSGGHLGADGLAFWYTKNRGREGSAFGNENPFTGLSVFLDTYQNLPGYRIPKEKIQVMVNNGEELYDISSDGEKNQVEECLVRFRNKKPSKLKVTYILKKLTVLIDIEKKGNWKPCIELENINLPVNYYFGFSAATGGLSDKHVIENVTFSFEREKISESLIQTKETKETNENIVEQIIEKELTLPESPLEFIKEKSTSIKINFQKIFPKIPTILRASLKITTVEKKITHLINVIELQENEIKDLQSQINEDFNKFIELVSEDNSVVDEKLKTFTSGIDSLSKRIEEGRKFSTEIHGNIKDETENIKEKIRTQTTFGLGWVLLILQIIGGIGYFVWKKKKDAQKKYYK